MNQVPVITTDECVMVREEEGGYGKYLVATKPIQQGKLITIFGGVTVKQHTHPDAYVLMTKLHKDQQDKQGGRKFEYSVQVGSAALRDSQCWVVPPQDLSLLKDVLKDIDGGGTSQLNTLVKRQPQAQGLGQYVQHTCCPKCVNAYIFPVHVHREGGQQRAGRKRRKEDEYMDLQCVAIRAQKNINEGEEIVMHYVGLGRAGGFDNIFECACCQCKGLCSMT